MGSGKTKTGRRLAAKLNFDFIDTDQFLELKYRSSIPDIFKTRGEKAFREMESETLHEILTNYPEKVIIATGGGLPCFNDNLSLLRSSGLTIYLRHPAAQLFQRLKENRSERPLIAELSEEELQEYITQTLTKREKFYNQADLIAEPEDHELKNLLDLISHLRKKD